MKQKLALSCALIHKPRILILDEPTTGVDAVSRTEFWEMLARLKKEGITIIVSTPYMDEALRCDRIALIQKGTIMGIDTPDKIRRSYNQKLYAVTHPDKYRLLLALRSMLSQPYPPVIEATGSHAPGSMPHVSSSEPFGDSMHVTLEPGSDAQSLLTALSAAGLTGATVEEIVPGIEDIFLELMKKVQ